MGFFLCFLLSNNPDTMPNIVEIIIERIIVTDFSFMLKYSPIGKINIISVNK